MTKILIVGDTHGDMEFMCMRVIPAALDVGAQKIMQLGDFGFIWPHSNYLYGLDKLNRALARRGLDLHFLPGNHEDHSKLEMFQARNRKYSPEGHLQIRPRIFYSGRVSSWTWEGVRIAAVGGATSIDKSMRTLNRDWWVQEQLTVEEAVQAALLGPVDVLFSHDAPTQNPFRLIEDLESEMHRQRITDVARALRPWKWYHGHYHRFAAYPFQHQRGYAEVFGLDCNHAPVARSTAVLDLSRVPVAGGV